MQEQIIIKILGQMALDEPTIDQGKIRDTLRRILDDYEIQPKSKALALNSDMRNYIGMYLATRKLDGLSKITLREYSIKLQIFSDWVPLNVDQVTAMDIRKFLAQYGKERGLKNSSLDAFQTVIKTFFNWLEVEDYIQKSPARKLKPIKAEKRTRKALTSEQLELLRLDGCKTTRDRAILEMFFSTGGRVSEIQQIDIDKINWQENSINIIGKGNKERTVYFSDKARLYIKRYIAERGILSTQALFVSERKPHDRLSVRALQTIINQIGANAGFEISIFPHLLRHTMATLGYKSGIALPIIQELLGHESPSTTQVYAELDKGTVKEAHRKHMSI